MLTTSVSIDGRLVNEQLVVIVDTKQDSSVILNIKIFKFEDESAGLTKMTSDSSEHK